MLKYEFTKEHSLTCKADIFAIGVKEDGEKKPGILMGTDGGTEIDKALAGIIKKIIKEENFSGELGKCKLIPTHDKIFAKNILLIGMGKPADLTLESLRTLGFKIVETANSIKASSIGLVLNAEKFGTLKSEERAQALFEGIVMGGYNFTRYKDPKDVEKDTLALIKIIYKANTAGVKKAIDLGLEMGKAINYARDLVNMPALDMTPVALAKEAIAICKGTRLTCKVMDEKEIKKERMELFLTVAKGSANPPRFIHIKYKPAKKAKTKVAIVGKGITFDSGGINLKPTRHIETMKCDMGGAAAVLGVMKLLPLIKPNVEVDGYIATCENMVDGKAGKPGDVVKSRSGKTVEIVNTDAEGRLILADALDYVIESKPDVIIDLATLTGGVLYALGEIYTAILGNDQKLIDKLIESSKAAGEPTWQLPMEKEYLKGYKEGIADLNNNGKTYAMTIGGALFLQEFIGKTKKWAHFDIAESAWSGEDRGYKKKGGTGAGIATLVKYLMTL